MSHEKTQTDNELIVQKNTRFLGLLVFIFS